jgi:hypothetical protein
MMALRGCDRSGFTNFWLRIAKAARLMIAYIRTGIAPVYSGQYTRGLAYMPIGWRMRGVPTRHVPSVQARQSRANDLANSSMPNASSLKPNASHHTTPMLAAKSIDPHDETTAILISQLDHRPNLR